MLPVIPISQAAPGMSAAYQEQWLLTADGQRLYMRVWPGGNLQPVVMYVHGIEGHSQWFSPTAARLQAAGMTVYALDRRGAGMNKQDRGHLGSYREILRDLEQLLRKVQAVHGQQALFLLGNCWGAQAAVVFARQNPLARRHLSGLILTCPALNVKCDLTFPQKLQVAGRWLKGSRKLFDIPLTPEMFTGNPLFLDYVRRDPLRLTQATAAFFVETLRLRRQALKCGRELDLPLLLLQAGQDAIVEVAAVERWFKSLPLKDKTWRLLDAETHSLDFSADAQDYIDVLRAWIQTHARAVPS